MNIKSLPLKATIASLGILAFFSHSLTAEDLNKSRTWTSAQGKPMVAKLLSYTPEKVTLEKASGKTVSFSPTLLSKKDQDLLKQWQLANKDKPKHELVKKLTWKTRYDGDATPDIEYVGFNDKRNAHYYKTKHFDFYIEKKMTTSTVSKCVAVFDCIVEALDDMPLDLDTVPKDGKPRYEAILVATNAQYMKLGGIPNSAGFFSSSRNLTVIKFESMGIVKKGSNYVLDGKNRDFTTLIHELVHHSTNHWRSMPPWMFEGMADYMANMPYRSGSFNYSSMGSTFGRYIRSMEKTSWGPLLRKGTFQCLSPKYLFDLNHPTWNATVAAGGHEGGRQYVSSMLFFYYFAHLDEDQGANLYKYIHAHDEAAKKGKIRSRNDLTFVKKYLLRDRTYEQLQEDMQKALSKKGIKIEFVR